MTDLVDQMFPPINRKTAPDFTDFNFWRAPVPQFELPDLSPPSPALSARSDSSRIGFPRLGSIASSLSRRSSKGALADGASSNAPSRQQRAGTPSSPLLQATLVEEPANLDDDDFDDDQRSESDSMPGSLPNDGDFERLRAAALAKTLGKSEAEEYKQRVKKQVGLSGEGDDDEDEGEEEEDEEEEEQDEFGDQLDFSSVPVSYESILSDPHTRTNVLTHPLCAYSAVPLIQSYLRIFFCRLMTRVVAILFQSETP